MMFLFHRWDILVPTKVNPAGRSLKLWIRPSLSRNHLATKTVGTSPATVEPTAVPVILKGLEIDVLTKNILLDTADSHPSQALLRMMIIFLGTYIYIYISTFCSIDLHPKRPFGSRKNQFFE